MSKFEKTLLIWVVYVVFVYILNCSSFNGEALDVVS